jgi:hypothetical protein
MASNVEICNRALQKIGAKRITSLTDDDSKNARACNVAFESCKLAELREHPWSFAVARAELAADSEEPDWGRANSFTLPADFVRLLPPYEEDNTNDLDWQIEGRKILTDDSAPLYIRYIKDVTDPNEMDALFREALACRIALEICEELTQSTQKLQNIDQLYKDCIRKAKRTNAIEAPAQQPPEDPWVTVRY